MNDIKAIETWYKGIKFRSRLEARWAVFFDACGIEYEYEPEGYEVNGEKYLPDFYLPGLDAFAEVKAQREGYEQEILRLKGFVRWGGDIKQIVILSNIPDIQKRGLPHFPAYYWSIRGPQVGWFFFFDGCHGVEGHISSCSYHGPTINPRAVGNGFSIESKTDFEIRMIPIEEDLPEWRGYEKYIKETNPNVFTAYHKARSARFEHGENGAIT